MFYWSIFWRKQTSCRCGLTPPLPEKSPALLARKIMLHSHDAAFRGLEYMVLGDHIGAGYDSTRVEATAGGLKEVGPNGGADPYQVRLARIS